MKQTEQDLRDFVDTASIGLHWVAADGTILWANPADYEPLGYSAEEYSGKNIVQFHADEQVIADILNRLMAGQRLNDHAARLSHIAKPIDPDELLIVVAALAGRTSDG